MPALAQRDEEPRSLGGEALVARLRGAGAPRPAVDPGMAAGMRDWLEDGLARPAAQLGEAGPVRVTKDTLAQVLVCEAHLLARRGAARTVTPELARGALVDALFRQWVTTGQVDDPWGDALTALQADGDRDGVAAAVARLPADRRKALADEVADHARRLTAAWPVLSPGWLARTQERLVVPLAGGRVLLSGVVDLALGAPSSGQASVCVVEVKSGRRRLEHRADLHFYALIETLRSGAPPFRVATYYTATGELDVEPVSKDVLVAALHRVLHGAERMCRLAAGAEPERTPNPLCGWCAGLPDCGPGQARAHSATPRVADGDEADGDDEPGSGGGLGPDEEEQWASR